MANTSKTIYIYIYILGDPERCHNQLNWFHLYNLFHVVLHLIVLYFALSGIYSHLRLHCASLYHAKRCQAKLNWTMPNQTYTLCYSVLVYNSPNLSILIKKVITWWWWCGGGGGVVWFTLPIIEPLQVVQLCSTLFNSLLTSPWIFFIQHLLPQSRV